MPASLDKGIIPGVVNEEPAIVTEALSKFVAQPEATVVGPLLCLCTPYLLHHV